MSRWYATKRPYKGSERNPYFAFFFAAGFLATAAFLAGAFFAAAGFALVFVSAFFAMMSSWLEKMATSNQCGERIACRTAFESYRTTRKTATLLKEACMPEAPVPWGFPRSACYSERLGPNLCRLF